MTVSQPARSQVDRSNVFQAIVLPNTGIQLIRGFRITKTVGDHFDEVRKAAERQAKAQVDNENLQLIKEHGLTLRQKQYINLQETRNEDVIR